MIKKSNSLSYLEGWLSIVVNILLFAFKYWAGIVTGSIAIIADAWHTLSDSLSSIIVLVGVKISSKPADKEHPFGHGRAELIASLIIGILLALIAFNFLLKSIHKLQNKESVIFGTIAIIAVVASVVLKEAMAQFAFWAGKKTNSNLLKSDAMHHRTDALSSVIILVGIFLGKSFWWIDGVLGIIVSIMIFYATYKLLKDSIHPLLGKYPNENLLREVQKICLEKGGNDILPHHFHIHEYGYHTELTFHLYFPKIFSLEKAHKIASEIENELNVKLDISSTIHMEPLENEE